MSHPRTTLRQAAVAALTGLATTGARVYVDREYALQPAELPCLHIAVSETTQAAGLPAAYARQLTLRVRALAKATSGLSTTLDQIALEVETALLAGLSIGSSPLWPDGFSATEPELSTLTDQTVGEQVLTFGYLVHVNAAAPGTPL